MTLLLWQLVIALSVVFTSANIQKDLVLSSNHLSKLLQDLVEPVYLGSDLAELLELAESMHSDDKIATTEMVEKFC